MPIETWSIDHDLDLDRPILAIGDVHGHADLLRSALDRALTEMPADTLTVFLGDLIDRGPDSIGCLTLARDHLAAHEGVFLRGNHEDMMLLALGGGEDAGWWSYLWQRNGGSRVLEELGAQYSEEARRALGDLWHFVEDTSFYLDLGDVICIHGGIEPGLVDADGGIDRQGLHEWATRSSGALRFDPNVVDRLPLWIRDPFLNSFRKGGACVRPKTPLIVHGHTPLPSDFYARDRTRMGIDGARLNLDLGSYATGRVGMALLERGQITFFDVS